MFPTFSNIANKGATTELNADIAFDNPSCPSLVFSNADLIAKNAATNKPTTPNDTVSVVPNVANESPAALIPLPNLPNGPGRDASLSSNCPALNFALSCASFNPSNFSLSFSYVVPVALPCSSNFCMAVTVSLICVLRVPNSPSA